MLEKVELSWTDTNNSEAGYVIERSTSPSTGFAEIKTTVANQTSYHDLDTALRAGTTYYYRVKGKEANGQGKRIKI